MLSYFKPKSHGMHQNGKFKPPFLLILLTDVFDMYHDSMISSDLQYSRKQKETQ